MLTRWEDFVRDAFDRTTEDSHVQFLKERLEQGWRLISAETFAGTEPRGYDLMLEYNRNLEPTVVPHSDAFTEWSVQNGIRMGSDASEVHRFSWVLEDRLAEEKARVGNDFFESVLVEVIHELAPPLAVQSIVNVQRNRSAEGESRWMVHTRITSTLVTVLGMLLALGYETREAAEITDRALTEYAVKQLRPLPMGT